MTSLERSLPIDFYIRANSKKTDLPSDSQTLFILFQKLQYLFQCALFFLCQNYFSFFLDFFLFECSVTESEPEGMLERIHIHYCSSVLIMVTAPLNGNVYFSLHLFNSAVTRTIFIIP